jgi:hypothetical protein
VLPHFYFHVRFDLLGVILPAIPITGSTREEIGIRLDIWGEIESFTGPKFFSGRKFNLHSVMVCTAVSLVVSCCTGGHDSVFTTFGFVSIRNLVLREDGLIRAFRDAGAAVDARIRIDIIPGVFVCGFPGDNTLYRADLSTATVTQA